MAADFEAAVAASLQGTPAPATPDPAQAARFGMQQAVGTNPDMEAELRRVADKTGVPLGTVQAFPEDLKREAAVGAVDFGSLAETAPSTARLLANIDSAKISHDDVGTLSGIERAVRSFVNVERPGAAQGVKPRVSVMRSAEFGALVRDIQAKNPALGFDEARALASQMATVDDQSALAGPVAQPKPTLANIIRGILNPDRFRAMDSGLSIMAADVLGQDPEQFIRQYGAQRARVANLDPQFETATGRGLYGGGVSLVQNAPGIALSIATGNPLPGLALAGGEVTAESYGKYRERGATPGQAAAGAVAEGAVEVGTELLPMSFLVNKLGKAGATEFIKGLLAREIPGEQLATLAQDAVDTAIANPDKTWAQYVAERPGAAYETLLATVVQTGVMSGGHVALERTLMRPQAEAYRAQRAGQDAQLVAQVMQAAAASKVRERDAATFEGFLQQATQDGPLEKVYVSAQELQAAGLDLTQLAEVAPSVAPQIEQALATGTDVGIPVSELATRLPGTPLEQVLLQHLKTDPGGFSQVGAQEYLQRHGEAVRAEVEKAMAEHSADSAFKESMRAVEDNVRQQLAAANRFTDDVNGPYAAMWASFFGVQAARLGVTPQDLFERFAPRIVAQTPAGALLDQFVPLRQALTFKPTRSETWDDGTVVEFGASPFPALPRKVDLPTGRHTPKDATVRISDLHSTQHEITRNGLEKPRDDSYGLPFVVHSNGVLYIQDGHHRLAQQAFAGETTANVRLVDLDALAGRAPYTGGTLRQSGAEVTRGSFDPNTNTLALLKAADLSTFLHESGHFFLEVLADLAAQPDAPAAIVADMNAFLKWVGVTGAEDLVTLSAEDRRQGVVLRDMAARLRTTPRDLVDSWKAKAPRKGTEQGMMWADLNGIPELALYVAEHPGSETATTGYNDGSGPGGTSPRAEGAAKRTALETWNMMTLDQKRPYHEDFARGFEAYLFEGKAPNVELRGLFQRFRAWLLQVYRSIAALNVALTPEIRGVFDRMLATNEQIRLAEDVRGYEALFKNKPDGMTDDEWAVYQLQASDATQQAVHDLETRSLRDMRWLANAKARELKRLQKEAAARRAEIEAEVRREVEALPVYRAAADIKEQRRSDPLEREALKAWQAAREAEEGRLAGVVKAEYLATAEGAATSGIQRGQFLARSKRAMANEVEKMLLQWEQQNPRPKVNIPDADLDAVAALHGFTSGDQLRKALDEAQPIKDVIEGMTDQRMLERHGDLVDERAIERAAEEAIHNDARMRFTATEANALRKATGQPALLAKAVRQFAADIVARTKVRELKPSVYTAAERRAAADAAKAMAENKLQDAAAQKRNQLINGYAAKAALAAQDEAVQIVNYLNRFNKESVYKTLDGEYVEQIHNMLERFDLRKGQSLVAIDKRTSLAAWLAAQEEAGLEPEIPPELADESRRTSYKNLTMEELRGLRDTVKQIEHLGRLKHKLLTAKDQRDYEAIRDSIVASIHEHAGDKYADNRTRPTALDAAARMFNGYVLEHRKLASLVREMDGFKDGGTFWEYLVRGMNEAGDREASMRAEATQQLAALIKPMLEGGKRGGRGQFFPGVGKSFNREERLGIALNMGNAGNIQRLLGGEGWTLAQVKPILDTLTAADWKFVQGVWDFFESYRPQIAAKEKRVYGREPNWVEPQPLLVETSDGKQVQLRGGYFPIKYDTAQSGRAEALADAELAKQQMRGAFTSATTRRSFTKTRADEIVGRPLMYSTDALFGGVNEVIHDLAWHEWLIDANRLLRSKAIDNAIRSRYGAEVARQLKSAVKDIAAGEFPTTHAFERVMGNLRAGTVIASMGLNIANTIINVSGITQSMVRIGPKWSAVGIGKFAQNPVALSREVAGKSKLMANRARTLNREVNEIQSLVRDKSTARAAADRIMFLPLTLTQQMVDLPTWWGAYQKALDAGEKEDRAVSLADQAVLDAQSGGQVKDLAAIQRGGPLLKLWTTFYGFFSSTYNLTVEATKATDFRDPLQVVGLAGKYMLLWTIPALLGTLLKNVLTGGDWDEERLAKKAAGDQISYLMGMMVGARDMAGAMQAATGTNEFNFGYGGPSGGRFFGEVYKLAQQAHQGEADAAFAKALSNVIGIVFHLPSTQVNRTVEGAVALKEGETSNPLVLVAGPPKD